MAANKEMKVLSPSDANSQGAQSIARAASLLRGVASYCGKGARLVDLSRHAKLERPTAHRILKCLIGEGLLHQDPESHRYLLGPLAFELGLAATPRFDFRELCQPMLLRIAEKSGDTVFLNVRSGNDIVCLDRKEGNFPIKTLTLDIGTRRPLGVGAGGMALLIPLPLEITDTILKANASRITSYGNLTIDLVLSMLERAKRIGYALNDNQVTPGAMSVALPLTNSIGVPYAAVSIGAIVDRMTEQRQKFLADILSQEISHFEQEVTS